MSLERQEQETMEKYRERRSKEKEKTNEALKGKIFWNSKRQKTYVKQTIQRRIQNNYYSLLNDKETNKNKIEMLNKIIGRLKKEGSKLSDAQSKQLLCNMIANAEKRNNEGDKKLIEVIRPYVPKQKENK